MQHGLHKHEWFHFAQKSRFTGLVSAMYVPLNAATRYLLSCYSWCVCNLVVGRPMTASYTNTHTHTQTHTSLHSKAVHCSAAQIQKRQEKESALQCRGRVCSLEGAGGFDISCAVLSLPFRAEQDVPAGIDLQHIALCLRRLKENPAHKGIWLGICPAR